MAALMTSQPIEPGYLLAGRYRIESPLGSGGHAYVFLARQEGLDREVAVKLLKSAPALRLEDLPEDKLEVMIKRFEHEARTISQLRDPGTITMYDYGSTQDGLFYMVTEYIQGESLKQLLKREGALAPRRAVKILEQLLYSLQEAHALGVLHRDIKPDNIMLFTHLGRRDRVKLLDFGIAKLVDQSTDSTDLTAEGSLVGTPRYIAPERIRGEELTPASDLYGLGLVVHEMLTGERVLPGKRGVHALQSQLNDPSINLPDHVCAPGALRQIVDRLTKKDLEERYKLAEQVIHDLEHWQRADLTEIGSEQAATLRLNAAVTERSAAIDPTQVLEAVRHAHEGTSTLRWDTNKEARVEPATGSTSSSLLEPSSPPPPARTSTPSSHTTRPPGAAPRLVAEQGAPSPPQKEDASSALIIALVVTIGVAVLVLIGVILALLFMG